MWRHFNGAFENQKLKLSFNIDEFSAANHVLSFAYYHGCLLLTKHKTRGWELPGGKCKPGEFPLDAAIREVYEETGAEIAAIKLIGQYCVEDSGKLAFIKNIYLAKILQIHPFPKGFETEAIQLLAIPPDPNIIKQDSHYSQLLKDDVYRLVIKMIYSKLKLDIQ